MSEEDEIHPIFLKDPEEWLQYVYKKVTVLQIRSGKMDNFGIISHNIFCDPSLELSRRGSSNEGSQPMFLLRNKKNYL